MIQIFLFPAGAAAVTDLLPRTLRGGRCPPLHSSLDAGAPPRAPGDFLTKRKSSKIRQEPPGSWTSGEGGLAPFDPPAFCPSGIGCGGKESAAFSGKFSCIGWHPFWGDQRLRCWGMIMPPKGSTQRGTPSGRFFGDFLIGEKVTRGGGAERPPHGEECRGWGAAPPRIVQYRPGAQPKKKRTALNRPVWAVEGGFTPRFHFNIYRSCPLTRGDVPPY